MKKVLLIGIGGVYNYGCEAILRGTEAILRSKWPDVEIVYATPRLEDDRKRLEGCNLTFVPRRISRYSPANITRKLLSLIGIRWQPCLEDFTLLKGVDGVFSIGGDIFTLRSDGSYNSSLAKFGMAAEERGVPYILWGASVGPFTAKPKAEEFFKSHFSKITQIVARERDTVEYLSSIDIISNVTLFPDPAFFVAPEIVKEKKIYGKKLTIGINLSPLSIKYSGLSPEAAISNQALFIERLVAAFDADIKLIPHVVCDFKEEDDDLRYLRKVWQRVSETVRTSVQVLETDPGFIGVKRVLVQCDLVIAARMHCAINAMASYVPTILLAYSQKAKGMADFIYGDRSMVIDLNKIISRDAYNIVQDGINNNHSLVGKLTNRMAEIRELSKSNLVKDVNL